MFATTAEHPTKCWTLCVCVLLLLELLALPCRSRARARVVVIGQQLVASTFWPSLSLSLPQCANGTQASKAAKAPSHCVLPHRERAPSAACLYLILNDVVLFARISAIPSVFLFSPILTHLCLSLSLFSRSQTNIRFLSRICSCPCPCLYACMYV